MFRGGGAGGEPERVFKSLAQKAAKGLPYSDSIGKEELWKVWLDVLRDANRNFYAIPVDVTLSTQACEELALSATKGVVESVTITNDMAESLRHFGFSAEPGATRAQRTYKGIAGVIRDLFPVSANYCLELEAQASNQRSPDIPPSDLASAQVARTPLVPATKQSRRGKQARSNAAIEDVKRQIRELYKAGYTQQQICGRLGKSPRPMNAAWRELAWPDAFRNPKYRAAVKSWISRA